MAFITTSRFAKRLVVALLSAESVWALLPPGSLNLTVPLVPEHLLGQEQTAIEPSTAIMAADLQRSENPGYFPMGIPAQQPKRGDLANSQAQFSPDNVQNFPLYYVGKVVIGHNDGNRSVADFQASGALVGQNFIIMNSQFIPFDQKSWWIRFQAAIDGQGQSRIGESYVSGIYGYRPGGVSGHDLVICRLSDPLGRVNGYFGSVAYSSLSGYGSQTFGADGYPLTMGNLSRPIMAGANVRIVNGFTESDAFRLQAPSFGDVTGMMGGPLWEYINGNPLIAGVMSGNTGIGSNELTNFAAGKALHTLVSYGRTNWG